MSAVKEAEDYGARVFEKEHGWQWVAYDPKGGGLIANPFRRDENGEIQRRWFDSAEEAAQDCLRVVAKMQVEQENGV